MFDRFKVDTVLGLALGLGYMTELRFWGPVGISEILVLLSLLVLLLKRPEAIFNFGNGPEAIVKVYLFFSFLIVLPLVSLIVFFFSDLKESDPIYILSFMMGILLMFSIVDAVKFSNFEVGRLSSGFCFSFLATNLIYIIFIPDSTSVRESSFSSNPNQLLFYITSITLLLVIYRPKLFWVAFPALFYIGYRSGSDAYTLSVFVVVACYLFLKVGSAGRLSFAARLMSYTLLLAIACSGIMYVYSSDIIDIWDQADEGGARLSLMGNAITATFSSPLFGWGAGSFSGIDDAFSGAEAHSTFLDLSMQFGIPVPLFLYTLMFLSFFYAVKNGAYLVASFILSFLVSGLFHFSGRHFTFWVEMAVFWGYVFNRNQLDFYKADR